MRLPFVSRKKYDRLERDLIDSKFCAFEECRVLEDEVSRSRERIANLLEKQRDLQRRLDLKAAILDRDAGEYEAIIAAMDSDLTNEIEMRKECEKTIAKLLWSADDMRASRKIVNNIWNELSRLCRAININPPEFEERQVDEVG